MVKVVGVKALKAKLSEYLRAVKAGDVFLITERDEVVAELRSANQPFLSDAETSSLDALSATGEVTLPAAPKPGWTWRTAGLGLAAPLASDLLEHVRQDRL